MKIKLKAKEIKSAGKVSIKHLDKDGNVLGERNFNNLLTDAYFAQNTFSPTASIIIGTGTTPPEVTDTSLENFYRGGSTSGGSWAHLTTFSGPAETATKRNRARRTATFSFTSPVTITEVGLGSTASSSGTLYARSLIKDEEGELNPFHMDDGHQLTVTYDLWIELPQQLTEIATIASPWPAPYDGDISVVIAARDDGRLTSYGSLGNAVSQFINPTISVNRGLGSITYILNRSTAFGTSDTLMTPIAGYNIQIGGLTYYYNYVSSNPQDYYHIMMRQERDGSDKRLIIPANHNFRLEFETGIDWGRRP